MQWFSVCDGHVTAHYETELVPTLRAQVNGSRRLILARAQGILSYMENVGASVGSASKAAHFLRGCSKDRMSALGCRL